MDVTDVLHRLREPDLSVAEAESVMAALDGMEAQALPMLFRRLRESTDERELHAVTRLLVRWRDQEVARALPPALRAMIAEPDVAGLNKLAAAGVLAALGQPLHDADLARHLPDVGEVKEGSLRRLIAASARAATLSNLIDRLHDRPTEALVALADDLGSLGDPAASRLLLPLAHLRDEDVALSAVAGLDRLGAWRAIDGLALIGRHHGSAAVRAQVGRTLERLEAARWRDAGEREVAIASPSRGCRMVEVGRSRVLLISAGRPDRQDSVDILVIRADAADELAEFAVSADLSSEERDALIARLGGRQRQIADEEAVGTMERLTAAWLANPTDAPLGWTAWREMLAPTA